MIVAPINKTSTYGSRWNGSVEMAEDGEIGGVSNWHYSFMGAQPIHEALSSAGEEVGRLLAADNVDVALLVPV